MHLDLINDKAKDFPKLAQPEIYTTARIWRCRYASLAPIARFTSLASLKVLVYPDETLEPLANLEHLEVLEITHLPKVSDIAPLAALKRLRHLTLATLPSWDSSSKTTTIASLRPLTTLPVLEELELFGVRPPDRRVDDLLGMPALRTARISQYPATEIQRLSAHLAARSASIT